MVNGYFQVCYPMCSLTNPQGCGPENQRTERSLDNVSLQGHIFKWRQTQMKHIPQHHRCLTMASGWISVPSACMRALKVYVGGGWRHENMPLIFFFF